MFDSKSRNFSTLISTDLMPPSQELYSTLFITEKLTEPSSISSSEKIRNPFYFNSIVKNLYFCKKIRESL